VQDRDECCSGGASWTECELITNGKWRRWRMEIAKPDRCNHGQQVFPVSSIIIIIIYSFIEKLSNATQAKFKYKKQGNTTLLID